MDVTTLIHNGPNQGSDTTEGSLAKRIKDVVEGEAIRSITTTAIEGGSVLVVIVVA